MARFLFCPFPAFLFYFLVYKTKTKKETFPSLKLAGLQGDDSDSEQIEYDEDGIPIKLGKKTH